MGTNLLFCKRFSGSQAAQWLSIQCNQCYKHCLCYSLVQCQDPTQINLTQPEKSLRNKREGEGARRNPQIPRNTMLNPPTWSAKQKPAQTKYKPRLHSQNNQTAEGQIIWNVHIAAGRTCLQPAHGGEEEWCLLARAPLKLCCSWKSQERLAGREPTVSTAVGWHLCAWQLPSQMHHQCCSSVPTLG